MRELLVRNSQDLRKVEKTALLSKGKAAFLNVVGFEYPNEKGANAYMLCDFKKGHDPDEIIEKLRNHGLDIDIV